MTSPERGVDPIMCHDFSVIMVIMKRIKTKYICIISLHESYNHIMNLIISISVFKTFELKVLVGKPKSCRTLAAWPLASGLQSGT